MLLQRCPLLLSDAPHRSHRVARNIHQPFQTGRQTGSHAGPAPTVHPTTSSARSWQPRKRSVRSSSRPKSGKIRKRKPRLKSWRKQRRNGRRKRKRSVARVPTRARQDLLRNCKHSLRLLTALICAASEASSDFNPDHELFTWDRAAASALSPARRDVSKDL